MATTNPVQALLDRKVMRGSSQDSAGPVSEMLERYEAPTSDRLLGFLLDMGYDQMRLVTCDAWKRKCGGVPKNSFVIVRLNEKAAGVAPGSMRRFLLLARIRETATTPVAGDIQNTIFQIHKVQATVDPFTNAELQWGALQADILGTYYDGPDNSIAFGNDVDSFLSPHFYEVYIPEEEHLERLINSFVETADPIKIGRLRYTETETSQRKREIEVRISPSDFVANRTALFGKTRMGKSNTIKVILDTMLRSPEQMGQVVFDLSGEYTYPDKQTNASIYLEHRNRCTRYSLKPRVVAAEKSAGVEPPSMLRANFYEQVELGHAIIQGLWDSEHNRRPDYVAPLLGWEPVDEGEIKARFQDEGEQKRYRRALSMYLALLSEAGFRETSAASERGGETKPLMIDLVLNQPIRIALAAVEGVADFAAMDTTADGTPQISDRQTLKIAARIYEQLWLLYQRESSDKKEGGSGKSLFPVSKSSAKPYFEPIHVALLRMIGDSGVSGAKKLTRFRAYHHPAGGDVIKKIVRDVEAGKTALIDLANADPVVARYYSEMIARAILGHQMTKFSEEESAKFESKSVLFYFEEAHNLFRADDKDLTSVYNKLAKEGAKFRIGMVYATQSMTTLSPDLLKNTENFFIAHLNDDREIREIERRYEFAGIGLDVQRARSRGYVRMITLSHRYALPVQIKLFQPGKNAEVTAPASGDGRSVEQLGLGYTA